MIPDHIISLGYEGVHIPPDATHARTTCPMCSETRIKADEPCLDVRVSGGKARAFCYHCEWWVEV
jgi:hypothetical protein